MENEETDRPHVYIAGRWGRREELLNFAYELRDAGCIIVSSWLWSNDTEDEENFKEYAVRDIEDLGRATAFILFTEAEPVKRNSRLVELGFALAWLKEVVIIGPRENIFCHLNFVRHCENIEQFWQEVDVKELGSTSQEG